MKTHYKLKNRKRFFTIITLTLLISFTTIYTTTVYGFKESLNKSITVEKGDTLWSIANKYSQNGDVRKFIYEVKKINNLNSSEIYQGCELLIPIK